MNNTYGYTWRERLADWLTGGRYSAAIDAQEYAATLYKKTVDKYAGQVDRYIDVTNAFGLASCTLRRIHTATKDGKSGTARKVARMAEDALK